MGAAYTRVFTVLTPGWDSSPLQDTQRKVTRCNTIPPPPPTDGMLVHHRTPIIEVTRCITALPYMGF